MLRLVLAQVVPDRAGAHLGALGQLADLQELALGRDGTIAHYRSLVRGLPIPQ
jgi:hypothetical protein